LEIFIDDVSEGTNAWTGTIESNSGDSKLGSDIVSFSPDIKMGDFRIYDRALTNTEIGNLYAAMPSYINVVNPTASSQVAVSPSTTTLRERHPVSSPTTSISSTILANYITTGESSPNINISTSIAATKITQASQV